MKNIIYLLSFCFLLLHNCSDAEHIDYGVSERFNITTDYIGIGIDNIYKKYYVDDGTTYCFISSTIGEQSKDFKCSISSIYDSSDALNWWTVDYRGTFGDNRCYFRCIVWDRNTGFSIEKEKIMYGTGSSFYYPLTQYSTSHCFITTINGKYNKGDYCKLGINDISEGIYWVVEALSSSSSNNLRCGVTCVDFRNTNEKQETIIETKFTGYRDASPSSSSSGLLWYNMTGKYDDSYCFLTHRGGFAKSSGINSEWYITLTSTLSWYIFYQSLDKSHEYDIGVRCVRFNI